MVILVTGGFVVSFLLLRRLMVTRVELMSSCELRIVLDVLDTGLLHPSKRRMLKG